MYTRCRVDRCVCLDIYSLLSGLGFVKSLSFFCMVSYNKDRGDHEQKAFEVYFKLNFTNPTICGSFLLQSYGKECSDCGYNGEAR